MKARSTNSPPPQDAKSGFVRTFAPWLDRLVQFMSTGTARLLILGLFIVQCLILVFVTNIGTPPDETNHYKFIDYYANHSVSPFFTDQQPTYNLGDKSREVDYLYHYGMSWVQRAVPFSDNVGYHVIRLFSIVFALLTMLALAAVFRRLAISDAMTNTVLLIVTNLPMVLLLSSAINNDTLVWLGTTLSVLLLLRLLERPHTSDLVWLATIVLLGGMVKRTLLPFGLVFGAVATLIAIRQRRSFWSQLRAIQWPNWRVIAMVIMVLVSVALFSERIVGNVAQYQSIAPGCETVHGEEACYVFWANVRERYLNTLPPEPVITPPVFVIKWVGESFQNIVDIQTQGWKHEVKPVPWLVTSLVAILVVGIGYGFAHDWRNRLNQQARWRIYVMLIALFGILVQLVVNFNTYQLRQVFGLALNGRYILPSVLLLAGLVAYYWGYILRRHPRVLSAFSLLVVLSVIFGSGLLMMLRNQQLFTG